MNIESILAEIRIHLEGGRTGAASDILFEFLFDNLGKPTAIDLPADVGILPPDIIVSHLRKSLNKLFRNVPNIDLSKTSASEDLEDPDFELILQTSQEYEARQKEYFLGEESQELNHLQELPSPVEKVIGKISVIDKDESQFVAAEITASDGLPEVDPVPSIECPEILSQDSDEMDSVDEDAEIFTAFEQEENGEFFSDEEWLIDDDHFYAGDEDERAELIDVESHGKIPRQERAWQVAYDLGNDFDWNDQGISLLQEVFLERGWQQAKVAMEFLMQEGMTPEQLAYAKELKENWDLRSELTIAFHYTHKDRSSYCYSGEKILSWRVAIEIVRTFDGCNDFDEIEQYIEEALDTWYTNNRLRRDYKSFLQYLRSSVGHQECLSPNLLDLELVEETYRDTNDSLFWILSEQFRDDVYGINLRPDIWQSAF